MTRAPTIDRHPVLVPRGDELWMIYENAQTEKYAVGRTNRRRLIVAAVTPRGLLAPKDPGQASALRGRGVAAGRYKPLATARGSAGGGHRTFLLAGAGNACIVTGRDDTVGNAVAEPTGRSLPGTGDKEGCG